MPFCEISKDLGCQFTLTLRHLTLSGLLALRKALASSSVVLPAEFDAALESARRTALAESQAAYQQQLAAIDGVEQG